jgi:uncharacterized protein YndB with AHSA1/START domain
MTWIIAFAIALTILGMVVLLTGWRLPEKHTVSRQATFNAQPEAIWSVITDVEAFPTWRTDVRKVTRLPDREGRPAWVEEGSDGRLTLIVERSERARLLVTRLADPALPFGGTWTYEIQPTPQGSTLTITEHGEIYNVLFRVMARFVFGYERTMAAYLTALDSRLASLRTEH